MRSVTPDTCEMTVGLQVMASQQLVAQQDRERGSELQVYRWAVRGLSEHACYVVQKSRKSLEPVENFPDSYGNKWKNYNWVSEKALVIAVSLSKPENNCIGFGEHGVQGLLQSHRWECFRNRWYLAVEALLSVCLSPVRWLSEAA